MTALPICAGEPGVLRESEVGGWKIVETTSFRCQSKLSWPAARELAASCEAWKRALQQHWLIEPSAACWTPRCEVIVHASQAGYGQTLGRPGDRSVGCTSLKCDGGRVVYRRIDIRSDAVDWSNSALPHELTHVVLADRFGDQTLPQWVNEGVAMLAEADDKHQLRWTALQTARRNQTTYPPAELMGVTKLPPAVRRDAFYSQSLSLVSYLIERKDAAVFWAFVDRLAHQTPEAAFTAEYGISLDQLHHDWRQWTDRQAVPKLSALRPESLSAVRGVSLADRRADAVPNLKTLAD